MNVNCPKCGTEFDNVGKWSIRKFCSRSCANSKTWTPEINAKRSKTALTSAKKKLSDQHRKIAQKEKLIQRNNGLTVVDQEIISKYGYLPSEITDSFCVVCGIAIRFPSYTHKKTCGKRICRTAASLGSRKYQNGSRKTFKYHNRFLDEIVVLESSWEVLMADWFSAIDLPWFRPGTIKWTDFLGKDHLYFPDFYIPSLSLYVDPKNPYCMTRDKEKLSVVSKNIRIVAGNPERIKEAILTLL